MKAKVNMETEAQIEEDKRLAGETDCCLENIVYALGVALGRRGYETASPSGERYTKPGKDAFGILKAKKIPLLGILGFDWGAEHIGTLQLGNGVRDDWVLKVHGEGEVYQEMIEVVRRVSEEPYGIKVQVIQEEEPRGIVRSGDSD